MASGNKKTTMAKLTRERRLRERRIDKQAKKDARKLSETGEPGEVLTDERGHALTDEYGNVLLAEPDDTPTGDDEPTTPDSGQTAVER
jgi:hypothetical protein